MGVNLVQRDDGSAELRSDYGAVAQARFGGPVAGAVSYRGEVVVRVPLAAVDTGGGVFAWQAPANTDVIVTRLELDVTAQSAGACTLDAGTTATGATTSSDNLVDGISVATAGLYSNLKNPGTNGKADQRLAASKWVTASVATGASSGLAGFAYIHYVPVGV
ncbi:MAG: hypothetical protein IT563_09770 [Alphaproteobacteria bacterium]|nr:hypothetical protein [Alphaproteobacteria bacterium]